MVSECVMCVMVMECTVKYTDMSYGISICNVCNGVGVLGTVKRNMLWYNYM